MIHVDRSIIRVSAAMRKAAHALATNVKTMRNKDRRSAWLQRGFLQSLVESLSRPRFADVAERIPQQVCVLRDARRVDVSWAHRSFSAEVQGCRSGWKSRRRSLLVAAVGVEKRVSDLPGLQLE